MGLLLSFQLWHLQFTTAQIHSHIYIHTHSHAQTHINIIVAIVW